MLYLFVFFVILVLYTVLFWIDLKAALEYIRNEHGEWIVLSFYTYDGFFRYSYDIPLLKTENNRVRFKLVKGQSREARTGSGKKEKLMPMDIYRKIVSVRTYLKDHRDLFEDIRKYLNKKDIQVELRINLMHGTGDAAQTGIIYGLWWTAAGFLTAWLSKYLKAFDRKISITPCFNKRILEVDASCIFHVRLVHIIVVLIKIFYKKYLIKMKTKKVIGGEVSG